MARSYRKRFTGTFCILTVVVLLTAVLYYSSLGSPSAQLSSVLQATSKPVWRLENEEASTPWPRATQRSVYEAVNQSNTTDNPDQHLIIPHTRNNPWPYILAFQYVEQQFLGVTKFLELLHLAAKWRLKTVDPFVLETGFGVPKLTNCSPFSLSDIYNLSSLESCITVSSFKDFLIYSTRELVWLNFTSELRTFQEPVFNCADSTATAIAAEKTLNSYVDIFKEKAIARHGKNYKFKVIKAICVDTRFSFISFPDVERAIAEPAGVRIPTVVIPNWIGLTRSSGKPRYVEDIFRWSCSVDALPRTQIIFEAADEYRKSLGLSTSFMGVHIQIELLRMIDKEKHGHLDQCLNDFSDVIWPIMRMNNMTSTNSVVAFNDYSSYGSHSCAAGEQTQCISAKLKVVKKLESLGIRTVAYNPEMFNRPHSRAFASFVEREFLSSADYLVTIGGGPFQTSIKELFKKYHGAIGTYSMCYSYRNYHHRHHHRH